MGGSFKGLQTLRTLTVINPDSNNTSPNLILEIAALSLRSMEIPVVQGERERKRQRERERERERERDRETERQRMRYRVREVMTLLEVVLPTVTT